MKLTVLGKYGPYAPAHGATSGYLLENEGNHVLLDMGVQLRIEKDKIIQKAPKKLESIHIVRTMPYPGFPTDMQAQFFALCAVADGTSMIVENVFENRFKHGAELLRMGASFTQKDRTIVIRGVERLMGTRVAARDLRGGAALTLAGLAAEGETIVENAELSDRGYERFDRMLASLGAQIRRENTEEETR